MAGHLGVAWVPGRCQRLGPGSAEPDARPGRCVRLGQRAGNVVRSAESCGPARLQPAGPRVSCGARRMQACSQRPVLPGERPSEPASEPGGPPVGPAFVRPRRFAGQQAFLRRSGAGSRWRNLHRPHRRHVGRHLGFGQEEGSNYSLVKVVKQAALPNGCTGGWVQATSAPSTTPLCAREFATGHGRVVRPRCRRWRSCLPAHVADRAGHPRAQCQWRQRRCALFRIEHPGPGSA